MDEEKEQNLEEIPEETSDFGEILANWKIPEFHKHEKEKKWYIYFSLVLIALLVFSYFSQDPLFAIILVFFAFTYWLIERKDPLLLDFALSEDGIIISNKFIDYKKIQNFYIIYQPPGIKNIYFQPRNSFKPVISIPLFDQDPVAIRQILLEFLPEDIEKEERPALDNIGDIFKL